MQRYNIDETWSIKIADDTDNWDRLFELVKQGVDNTGEKEVDIEFLYECARNFYVGPLNERVFLVLYKDLKPAGVLLGIKVDTHPVFRKTGITIEQLWWVDPQHRGYKQSAKLIEAFEEWSRHIGVKRCVMSHFKDPVGDKLQKFYERSGYKLVEQSYVKELI